MLTALIAGSGVATSAAVALFSGAAQAKASAEASQSLRQADSASADATEEVVKVLAPAVIDLAGSAESLSEQARSSAAKRELAAADLHMPLIEAVDRASKSQKQVAGSTGNVRSKLSKVQGEVKDLEQAKLGLDNERAMLTFRRQSALDQLRSDAVAARARTAAKVQEVDLAIQQMHKKMDAQAM